MPWKHKSLLLLLATYGDLDGSHVRPGTKRLAAVTGWGETSIKRYLRAVRGLGLLTVTCRGGGRSHAGRATEYQLTIPADLLERAQLLDPDEHAD